MPEGWEEFFLKPELKAEIKRISEFLIGEVIDGKDINPALGDTFRAFYEVRPAKVKVVILGQDPAPTKGQATGLAFSLAPGTPSSQVPSVERVQLEALNEGICVDTSDGDLSAWAHEGVLMLNTALTIPCPASQNSCVIAGHLELWEEFTSLLAEYLNALSQPVTYLLWGGKAAQFGQRLNNPKHQTLRGGHPSPQASGERFFCKSYFSCANTWLKASGTSEVDWNTHSACQAIQPCFWGHGDSPICLARCKLAACPF